MVKFFVFDFVTFLSRHQAIGKKKQQNKKDETTTKKKKNVKKNIYILNGKARCIYASMIIFVKCFLIYKIM